MLVAVLILGLAQPAGCGSAVAAVGDALARASTFDVSGAIAGLEQPPLRSCEAARVAAIYLRGLQAAREAYRTGGDDASLAPVRAAAKALEEEFARSQDRRVEISRVVLLAAEAAAQSERGDMEVFLTHAATLERQLLLAGERGAPGVSAHEAAGDLWLQVHRFDAARAAYQAAIELMGATPRTTLGLARVALRTHDDATACRSYAALLQMMSATTAAELGEVREALASPRCAASPGPRE